MGIHLSPTSLASAALDAAASVVVQIIGFFVLVVSTTHYRECVQGWAARTASSNHVVQQT